MHPTSNAARKRFRLLHIMVRATIRLASTLNLRITPSSDPSRVQEKRALLIGISYAGKPNMHLKGPSIDVQDIETLLIKLYGYDPENIVVLTDEPSTPPEFEPTRKNIMREIESLAASGAKYQFFLYSGHSSQRPEVVGKNGKCVEDDGQEEYVIPSDAVTAKGEILNDDAHIITDKVLKKHIVKGLKKNGSQLVALFDSCHSGTLLNLRHQKCNEFEGVWNRARCACRRVIDLIDRANVLEGKDHRSDTEQVYGDVPITAGDSRPSCSSPPPIQKTQTQMTSSSRLADVVGSKRLRSICRGIFRGGKQHNHCSGFCPVISFGKSQIICISACRDSQQNFECGSGGAMTKIIVKHLYSNPKSTYRELMRATKYNVRYSRKEAKRRLKAMKPDAACPWAWIPGFDDWHKKCRDEKYRKLETFIKSESDPQLSTRYPFNLNTTVKF